MLCTREKSPGLLPVVGYRKACRFARVRPDPTHVREKTPMRTSILFLLLAGLSLLGAPLANAATLSSDLPSPQPAGTTVTFTIGGSGAATERYRLSVAPANDPGRIDLIHDDSPDNLLEWTRVDPGTYLVTGSVLNRETGEVRVARRFFTINPAVPPAMVVARALPTSNPLVALYVAPPCPPNALMRVRFLARGTFGEVSATNPKRCVSGVPVHVHVAGMREQMTYQIWHELLTPNGTVLGQFSPITFRTGQALIQIPPSRQTLTHDQSTGSVESVIWYSPLIGNPGLGLKPYPHATDLDGRLIWYLNDTSWALRPSGNGTFWALRSDPFTGVQDNVLVKLDLLGQVVKQTNIEALNDRLGQLGYLERINDIHHDVRDLPNGDIAFIASTERLVRDVQGPGEVSVIGDMIIVTNRNFEIRWVWNGWDHLDPTRLATQGEVCTPGAAGCSPFFLADEANDWTHANGLAYTPDGNLILSLRHQDWVVKIDYANGIGDGAILWRLGPEGDFRLLGGNTDDWFSHQHDPSFVTDNRIILFDNGNLRCDAATASPDCQSRGQVWEIDEVAMTAERVFNRDLGAYAYAVGSAQQLLNGNYWFDSGFLGSFADPSASLLETDPSGSSRFQIDVDSFQYRAYRLIDFYTAPSVHQ